MSSFQKLSILLLFSFLLELNCTEQECTYSEKCTLVKESKEYYAIYVENNVKKSENPKFLGFCDENTLKVWHPCLLPPNLDPCEPNTVFSTLCDIRLIAAQKQCQCNCTLNSRPLEAIPDFPTCVLESPFLKRHTARSVINNCIGCMAKQRGPDSRGVKRSKMTPPSILSPSGTKKKRKLCGRGPWKEFCSFTGKDGRNTPDDKEKEILFRKRQTFELSLDSYADDIIDEILRRLLPRHIVVKRQKDETAQDDDDVDDDDESNNGEQDIAVEEEKLVTRKHPTSKHHEHGEIKQQEVKDNENSTDYEDDSDGSITNFPNFFYVLVSCALFYLH